MADLSQFLATTPGLSWISGTITAVSSDSVTLNYGGGDVANVAYLDQYTPVVGDIVHALSQGGRGVLVLGSDNKVGLRPDLPDPLPAVTAAALSWGTYSTDTSLWTSGVVQQDPVKQGAWFFSRAPFAGLDGQMLDTVEMSVLMTSGGPPELVPIVNQTAIGPLQPYEEARYLPDPPAVGVQTWMALPLDWGYALIAGQIGGISVGGAQFTGAYTGGGTSIRITPL